jgi:exosortase
VLGLSGLLLWVLWPTLALFLETWQADPQYSHGYLVPAFSAYLLWSRRAGADFTHWQTSWWGVAALAAAGLLRLAGAYLSFDWLEGISLLPLLAGLALLLGGRAALKWSWPAVAFLAFMVPLPYRVAHSLSEPLQRLTTEWSGAALQTLGFPAIVEGNTILMGTARIAVVEACSGLSMLLVFGALATAAAIVVRRPLLDRVVLLLCAAPIAVVANIIRITATGVALATGGQRLADLIFHDLAGWLMMPLAVVMLVLVTKLLDVLLVSPPKQAPAPPLPGLGRRPAAKAAAAPRPAREAVTADPVPTGPPDIG